MSAPRAADAARVTVGLPVHNGERYLEAALESILGQDLGALRVIVADNGSTDGTEAICRRATARDQRVQYHRSPMNRGATWNYNRLVAMADTEYFKWAAHDDLLEPSFLSACIDELDRAPRAVLAYPRTVLIDGAGNVVDERFEDGLDLRSVAPEERWSRYLAHPGEQHAVFGVMRTSDLRRTGLIANCWGGDVVLLASLALRGAFHEVPDRLFKRRYHAGSSMVSNPTPADVARWYDPAAPTRFVLPRARLTIELLRVAMGAELPLRARGACAVGVARRWLPMYGRVIGGELKGAIRAALPR